MKSLTYLFCASLLLLAGPLAFADNTSGVNLIADGAFNTPGAAVGTGGPWQRLNAAGTVDVEAQTGRTYEQYEVPGGGHPSYTRPVFCLNLQSKDPAAIVGAEQTVALNPSMRSLVLTGSVMVGEVEAAAPAQCVRCAVTFTMQDRSLRPCAQAPVWTAPTGRWTMFFADINVPSGATSVTVSPMLDRCSGQAQFEDLGLGEVPAPTKWVMTFDDEFNGPKLDHSKWTANVGNYDWQKGYYLSGFSPSNVSFENGAMRITAEKSASGGMPYTSAEIMTLGKFAQLYGAVETRIRMPMEIGSWPAVYLIPCDDTWPPEIDVAEATGRWPTVRMINNHWKDQDGVHLQWSATHEDQGYDRTQWHVHRVVWDRGCLRFYDDGKLIGATYPETGIADMPMYLRINQVVGGWGGDPSPGKWPQYFDVDYIRVYQRADRPLPVTLGPSQEITLPNKAATLTAQTCNPIGDGATQWTLVNGPGAATIASPLDLTTTVTCTAVGMYRFRFTIRKDGAVGSQDELVYLNPAVSMVQAATTH